MLYWKTAYGLVFSGLGVAAVIALGVNIGRDVVLKPVVIDVISVPDELDKAGFSSAVAVARLRDHIVRYENQAQTEMSGPQLSLQGDAPDIAIPAVGVSVSTISKMLLGFFHLEAARKVSGEITSVDGKLRLALRLNGDAFFSSPSGTDPHAPDALMEEGAQAVLDRVAPYYVAVTLAKKDTAAALAQIDAILARRLPQSDNNVVYAYNLRGIILQGRKRYAEARQSYEKTLEINPRFSPGHYGLADMLQDEGRNREALAELELAARYDQNYAAIFNLMGLSYQKLGKPRDAEVAFKRNIDMDRTDPNPHDNLGALYKEQGDLEKAVTEFRIAAKLAPSSADFHNDLARVLLIHKDYGGALHEFRIATKLDPRAWNASFEGSAAALKLALNELGQACRDLRRTERLRQDIPSSSELISEIAARRNGQPC